MCIFVLCTLWIGLQKLFKNELQQNSKMSKQVNADQFYYLTYTLAHIQRNEVKLERIKFSDAVILKFDFVQVHLANKK